MFCRPVCSQDSRQIVLSNWKKFLEFRFQEWQWAVGRSVYLMCIWHHQTSSVVEEKLRVFSVLTITSLIMRLFTRAGLTEIKTSNDFFPHYKLLVQVLSSFPDSPLKEVAAFTYWLFLMSLTLFPFWPRARLGTGQWQTLAGLAWLDNRNNI